MADPAFAVVGIGASAGGVEALTALFRRMPPEPHAAFIVVTHLAPDRDSLMPEIIGRVTTMPTVTARDGECIQPGHVYLNSPVSVLTVVDGRLVLKPRHNERNPVDILLASLAREFGERAIAVILSGTGSDGALGLKAVREAGGVTFAQGRGGDGPSYPGMPQAAIGTGYVDRVVSIEELADGFAGFIGHMGLSSRHDIAEQRAVVEDAKTAIYAALQQRTGHDFSRYKDKTFLRRVERRMKVHQVTDLPGYVQLIRTDENEALALFRDLLIGVTGFFRDGEAFGRLAELVIPKILEGKGSTDAVRVWVSGCATGEEVYSLAILLREMAGNSMSAPRLQIFATDIDEEALTIARLGRYPANLLTSVSPERLARFFVRDGESYTVTPEIRECCLFSPQNILRDPPFSQIDLVSCRNLLIYFNAELQSQVIPVFHYALRRGGYLFLGNAENLTQHGSLFAPLDKKFRIYQRKDSPSRLPAMALASTPGSPRPSRPPVPARASKGDDVVRQLERRVLERYAPAHILVNRDGEVIHYSARTGKYLEAPAGAPTRNLLAMARGGLNLPLRSALREVQESGRPARRDAVAVQIDGDIQTVDIAVEPLPEIDGQPFWLIIFTDIGSARSSEEIAKAELARAADRDGALLHLEQDLNQTRERLQTTVEEYETATEELKSSNEELLSLNEELQSSNEELESSKEELQSINEEMSTVNAELASKVDELDRASADLRNLLDITRIATIFLDGDLVIRNFTPAMNAIYKLISTDRGRSLADIVSHIDYDGLVEDVHKVLGTSEPLERRVVRRDGSAHYLMRIVPYETMYDKVNGAIITFLNVSDMVKAEERQRLLVAELNHRVKNILSVVASMAAQMARRSTSVAEFAEGFVGRIHGLAKTHDILSAKEWSDVDLAELLQAELDAFILDAARASLNGPKVELRPQVATTLGIVIHELATNAVKYGAFANRIGRLRVEWAFDTGKNGRDLVLTWTESGGPPVEPPERTGLGSELIRRSLDFELGGRAAIDYRPEGVVVTLVIPATAEIIQHTEGVSP
ncbi:CheR family methyltransferase [Magnetospirillum sp. UT-4]|uniref:CheR family methyltransferase n=1 Tax=Magnetospirillum sp. UT-4 TaxID=2681467 RepID=UPI0013865203|nr:CheR family methyltransferase [Magnetospirillum sp. UT-4]CAA7614941.1 Chemotaxis protein methyltransferase [Magnetospirillum sp. UT-4]